MTCRLDAYAGDIVNLFADMLFNFGNLRRRIGICNDISLAHPKIPAVKLLATRRLYIAYYADPYIVNASSWMHQFFMLFARHISGGSETVRDLKIARFIDRSVPPKHVEACKRLHKAFMAYREVRREYQQLCAEMVTPGCPRLSRHFYIHTADNVIVSKIVKRIMLCAIKLYTYNAISGVPIDPKRNTFNEAIRLCDELQIMRNRGELSLVSILNSCFGD